MKTTLVGRMERRDIRRLDTQPNCTLSIINEANEASTDELLMCEGEAP